MKFKLAYTFMNSNIYIYRMIVIKKTKLYKFVDLVNIYITVIYHMFIPLIYSVYFATRALTISMYFFSDSSLVIPLALFQTVHLALALIS